MLVEISVLSGDQCFLEILGYGFERIGSLFSTKEFCQKHVVRRVNSCNRRRSKCFKAEDLGVRSWVRARKAPAKTPKKTHPQGITNMATFFLLMY